MDRPSDRPEPGRVAASQVMERLLTDIRSGALSPGTWLKQIDLEERYGAGRPAIRQALERLAEKRLIGHVRNRGYHVHRPDGQQTSDLLAIRLYLEVGAADRIVEQATPEAAAELERLAVGFDALIEDGPMVALYEANLSFHRFLLSIAGNDELVQLVDELRQRMSSAPVSQWISPGRIRRSAAEHHQMVAAIKAGASEDLKAAIRRHILQPDG